MQILVEERDKAMSIECIEIDIDCLINYADFTEKHCNHDLQQAQLELLCVEMYRVIPQYLLSLYLHFLR